MLLTISGIIGIRNSLSPSLITYASFAGLAIIATVIVGIIKYNQTPNFYTSIGLGLIIVGVVMVNLMGNNNS